MPNLKTKKRFWETPTFKQIENEWYLKLAQTGFTDAEIQINGKNLLRQHANNSYRSTIEVVREAKQRYYELLGHHYFQEKFTDSVENIVMQRRANGTKIKAISEELKILGERNHRETVRLIIQKYEVKWGLRKKR